ncbi:MAG: beta-1,4-mannosyl-glycoprotein beta-1,4-N-acetylglucosaminyltransferase [Pelagibacterales bacterium]|jgi:beta-1,4-mannosyl-glycoprotein beta-1,4-N-acetylglucosaminyltransferase|nr:beta-1,4-mannosyl-glycoprotein beta-1,4-N-acetylglucosaminyltransferase [Pelagibacterales bacterium]
MAIYDCFQYYNEDHMIDLRMNILNEDVDYFVISESTKNHQGENKKLNFNINNFPKFKKKIIYLVADYKENKDFDKHMGGESVIEQHQRNYLINGLNKANDNDMIILSDSDEIPDLNKLDKIKITTKFAAFSQKMFMYKINLQNISESNWIGSKVTLKKNLPEFQKLRNLKFKDYPFWRIDKLRMQIINGGWHFSFLQTPKDIVEKIKSYSHGEFNKDKFINEDSIEKKILENKDIFERGFNLKKIELDETFPHFIQENKKNLTNWII